MEHLVNSDDRTIVRFQASAVVDERGVRRIQKSHAYLIRAASLLVFAHRDSPESGTQIPAGTIRVGERPEDAVMREVYEETGLHRVRLVGLMNCHDCDVDPSRVSSGHQHQRRYAFHLVAPDDTPDAWLHWERGDGDRAPIAFEFSWVPLVAAANLVGPFVCPPGVRVIERLLALEADSN